MGINIITFITTKFANENEYMKKLLFKFKKIFLGFLMEDSRCDVNVINIDYQYREVSI